MLQLEESESYMTFWVYYNFSKNWTASWGSDLDIYNILLFEKRW